MAVHQNAAFCVQRVSSGAKFGVALRARVRPFSGVDARVNDELLTVSKGSSANGAYEWLLACVDHCVTFEMAGRAKSLAAQFAFVRTLLAVHRCVA